MHRANHCTTKEPTHMHTCTHARTHMHTHTHARTHTHTPEECARHRTVQCGPIRFKYTCHVTPLFEPDCHALYSAGPARIPLEHGACARLSRPFLDFLLGGSGYVTSCFYGTKTSLDTLWSLVYAPVPRS